MQTWWDGGAGAVGFDPVARRRVRRAGARARPALLPVAVVVAALVTVGARPGATVAAPATAAPAVPGGLVLVAVQPDDPAVLGLATPGSRVDVYAADPAPVLDPTGGTTPAPARLVVAAAPVLAGPAGTSGTPGAAADVLAGPVPGAGSLTLAVSDDEAAALASRPGGTLLVAVRGSPGGG